MFDAEAYRMSRSKKAVVWLAVLPCVALRAVPAGDIGGYPPISSPPRYNARIDLVRLLVSVVAVVSLAVAAITIGPPASTVRAVATSLVKCVALTLAVSIP